MVDLSHLVGIPFEYGGRGPHAYDCYGLVKECYRLARGIELPDFQSPRDQGAQAAVGLLQLQTWRDAPRTPGVLVAFRIGRLTSHCGFLLDHDTMIHAWEKSGGVTIQRLTEWQRRITGFYDYAR